MKSGSTWKCAKIEVLQFHYRALRELDVYQKKKAKMIMEMMKRKEDGSKRSQNSPKAKDYMRRHIQETLNKSEASQSSQSSEKSATRYQFQSMAEASSSTDDQHSQATSRQIEKTEEQSKSEKVGEEKLEKKSVDALTDIEPISGKQAEFFAWLDNRGENDPKLWEKLLEENEAIKELIKKSNLCISPEGDIGKVRESLHKSDSQIREIEEYIHAEKWQTCAKVQAYSYFWEKGPEQTLQQLCLLRNGHQMLEEMERLLHQPLEEYQQERLDGLQKLHEMQTNLLVEHECGGIPQEFVQEQINTLQEHWNVMQKLHNIENDPENANLSPAQQENVRKTVRDLQESNKKCCDNYCKALQDYLDIHQSLSDIQIMPGIKQKYSEIMPKYCNTQKEVCKFQDRLTSIVLSLAQRENWETTYSDEYNAIRRWSDTLARSQSILSSHLANASFLDCTKWDKDIEEIQSLTCKRVDKIINTQENIMEQTKEFKDISEGEQQTLRKIKEIIKEVLFKVTNLRDCFDYSYRPDYYKTSMENYFKEKFLEGLEKYPKIRYQLQHTCEEMSPTILHSEEQSSSASLSRVDPMILESQIATNLPLEVQKLTRGIASLRIESENASQYQKILEVCKGNLEKLVGNYEKILDTRNFSKLESLLRTSNSRVRLIQALEALTDPNLWQAEDANMRNIRLGALQMWQTNLDQADETYNQADKVNFEDDKGFKMKMKLIKALESFYRSLTNSYYSQEESTSQWEKLQKMLNELDPGQQDYLTKLKCIKEEIG